MGTGEGSEDRPVRRSAVGSTSLVAFGVLMAALLVYEVIRENQPPGRDGRLPWASVLGVPTSASFLTAAFVAWVAREQFARSVKPVLRYVSRWAEASQRDLEGQDGKYRQVLIRNVGAGAATVVRVEWRVAAPSSAPRVVTSMEALRDLLRELKLVDARDYSISNYGSRTALAPNEERLYFECTKAATKAFATFEAVFDYESLVGDTYRKTVSLLPNPGASAAVVLLPQASATA